MLCLELGRLATTTAATCCTAKYRCRGSCDAFTSSNEAEMSPREDECVQPVQLQARLFFTSTGRIATSTQPWESWKTDGSKCGTVLAGRLTVKLWPCCKCRHQTPLKHHSQNAAIGNVTAGSHTADRLHRLRNLRPSIADCTQQQKLQWQNVASVRSAPSPRPPWHRRK